jgi:hypothetical protein
VVGAVVGLAVGAAVVGAEVEEGGAAVVVGAAVVEGVEAGVQAVTKPVTISKTTRVIPKNFHNLFPIIFPS